MSGRRGTARNVRKARGSGAPWNERRRRSVRVAARVVGFAAVLTTVCVGGPAAWEWCRTHPYFAVRDVEIVGQARLTRQDVMSQAGVSSGTSVWDAAPAVVERRLRENPWIATVAVERRFPGFVRIVLQERQPVAIARLNGLYYVDEAGHVLGSLRDGDSPDFPLITGVDAEGDAGFATVALRRAARVLRSCAVAGWTDSVSEVHVDPQRGVTVYPLERPVPVVLGWGSWEEKLVRAGRALAAWKGREAELAQVDASFADLVVVRLRDKRTPADARPRGKGIQV